jgi:hypothetical protein
MDPVLPIAGFFLMGAGGELRAFSTSRLTKRRHCCSI